MDLQFPNAASSSFAPRTTSRMTYKRSWLTDSAGCLASPRRPVYTSTPLATRPASTAAATMR
jgi:hypothetical protein